MSEPESVPANGKSLAASTGIMAAGTLVSRVLGFVKGVMLVGALGINIGAANAFDLANRIPNQLFTIIASGVLNAVLVPQIVKAFARPGGKRTVDRILTLGGFWLLVISALLTSASALFVALFADNWSPDLKALAIGFSLWCIPQVFFYGMYTLLGQLLNAREQFGPFMWAPAANNIVAIAGLGAYLAIFGRMMTTDASGKAVPADALVAMGAPEVWTSGRIALVAGVATLGIAVQAFILIWPLVKGGYRWRWTWSGNADDFVGIRKVAGWALAAVLLEQAGVVITTRVAAAAGVAGGDSLTVASNAAYTFALMIVIVPHSLVTVSIATALFTRMAKQAAANDLDALRATLSSGLRTIGVFATFAATIFLVLAPAAARVLAPGSPPEIRSVAWVIMAMALGLVPLGAMVLIKWVYFALEDGRSVFRIQIPMTITVVGVALLAQALWEPRWWVAGIGLGMAASNTVAGVLRYAGLRTRLGGLDARRVGSTHLRALAAAIPAGGIGWWLTTLLPDAATASWLTALGIAAGVGSVMAVLYGTGLWALRVSEMNEVLTPLLRKLGLAKRP